MHTRALCSYFNSYRTYAVKIERKNVIVNYSIFIVSISSMVHFDLSATSKFESGSCAKSVKVLRSSGLGNWTGLADSFSLPCRRLYKICKLVRFFSSCMRLCTPTISCKSTSKKYNKKKTNHHIYVRRLLFIAWRAKLTT